MIHPLVTVGVITYNSSNTIISTLNSIFNQTYKDIELIISDDASNDNTLSLCEDWISHNKDRFRGTRILSVEKNTGVTANCNRVISYITGVYYKGIAGDDNLIEDCIDKNVKHMLAHKEIDVLYSNCYLFSENNKGQNIVGALPTHAGKEMLKLPVEKQKIVLYYGLFLPTPTLFMKSDIIKRFRYDERYSSIEDYPFVLKLTENGIKLNYLDDFTVMYRISNSVSHPSCILDNERMWHSHRLLFDNCIREKIVNKHPRIYQYKMARFILADFRMHVLNNKNTRINHFLSFVYRQFLRKYLSMNEEDVVNYAKLYNDKES